MKGLLIGCAAGLGISLAVLGVTPVLHTARIATTVESLVTKQLLSFAAALLNNAHERHDDLAQQDIVRALSQMKRLHFAAILDTKDTAIAHSDVSRLGQNVAPPYPGRRWAISLNDARGRWGTLVVVMSPLQVKRVPWSYVGVVLFATLGVVAVSVLAGRLLLRRLHRAEAELTAAKTLTRTEGTREPPPRSTATKGRRWWEHLQAPVAVFDEAQRLLYWSPAVTPLLHPLKKGQSWFEISELAIHASSLAQSLQSPDIAVTAPQGKMSLTTFWENDQRFTLVEFYGSLL
jgi:hypothetical protein